MIVDRPSMYGSRNMFDQHRDMRMDIDNMSYEVIIRASVLRTSSQYNYHCEHAIFKLYG